MFEDVSMWIFTEEAGIKKRVLRQHALPPSPRSWVLRLCCITSFSLHIIILVAHLNADGRLEIVTPRSDRHNQGSKYCSITNILMFLGRWHWTLTSTFRHKLWSLMVKHIDYTLKSGSRKQSYRRQSRFYDPNTARYIFTLVILTTCYKRKIFVCRFAVHNSTFVSRKSRICVFGLTLLGNAEAVLSDVGQRCSVLLTNNI